MKTSFDVVDLIYAYLRDNSPVKQLLSGGVYKHLRPINSKTEDVVINSLGLNNAVVQNGVANVNVYVPNLILNINGMQDTTQPNHKRLKELTAVLIEVLHEVWIGDYMFEVQQEQPIFDPDGSATNIRLNFFSINNSIIK